MPIFVDPNEEPTERQKKFIEACRRIDEARRQWIEADRENSRRHREWREWREKRKKTGTPRKPKAAE
jgi:hypothetical protein